MGLVCTVKRLGLHRGLQDFFKVFGVAQGFPSGLPGKEYALVEAAREGAGMM